MYLPFAVAHVHGAIYSEYSNVAWVHPVRTSWILKANELSGCDSRSSIRFPQLARAFRVEIKAFVYSFESEKSQRKLLQNDQ